MFELYTHRSTLVSVQIKHFVIIFELDDPNLRFWVTNTIIWIMYAHKLLTLIDVESMSSKEPNQYK
jgi:hypothetical protein